MKNTVKSFSSLCFFREPQEDLFFFPGFYEDEKALLYNTRCYKFEETQNKGFVTCTAEEPKKKKFSLNPLQANSDFRPSKFPKNESRSHSK